MSMRLTQTDFAPNVWVQNAATLSRKKNKKQKTNATEQRNGEAQLAVPEIGHKPILESLGFFDGA